MHGHGMHGHGHGMHGQNPDVYGTPPQPQEPLQHGGCLVYITMLCEELLHPRRLT